jgi:biotin operon repressor
MTRKQLALHAGLASALARHQGRASGITGAKLARELGVSMRQLRLHISTARERGVAVCGHPGSGYYLAATAGELQECCAFLRSRALHSLRLEALLRKVPLPHLLGQLQLLELDA